jgi:hypothetical protein
MRDTPCSHSQIYKPLGFPTFKQQQYSSAYLTSVMCIGYLRRVFRRKYCAGLCQQDIGICDVWKRRTHKQKIRLPITYTTVDPIRCTVTNTNSALLVTVLAQLCPSMKHPFPPGTTSKTEPGNQGNNGMNRLRHHHRHRLSYKSILFIEFNLYLYLKQHGIHVIQR